MIFLIVYDRRAGRIVTLREFEDAARPLAEEARLEADLEYRQDLATHEVILLEAASQTALRETHRRYFEDLEQIATRGGKGPRDRDPGATSP
ncbi:MAG: hypothetical protein IPJ77_08565 [Planctomycetes bacterium]|nr:hypothetical protein [Planctomycetota bacterium]